MPAPIYLSINEFPGDGVTTQYEFSFAGGYIDPSHVKAYVTSALGVITPVTVLPEMFVTDNTLDLGIAAEVGGLTRIYRETPRDEPLLNFEDGARLTAANFDLLARQTILGVAEAFDAGAHAAANDLLGAAGAALAAADAALVAALDAEATFLSPGIQSLVTNLAQLQAVADNVVDVSAVAAALSDISAAVADLPALAAKVSKTGDTMTGHLSTIAGASGAQVPQAQEALLKAGNLAGLANTGTARTNLGLGSAATRTALGTTGALYSRDSILGTVSQAAGVPTGAVVQRGSNASGQYVRFADGTQICYYFGETTVGAGTTWSFPIAFSGAPIVSSTVRTATPLVTATFDASSTQCGYGTWNLAGSLVAGYVALVAVGRWF